MTPSTKCPKCGRIASTIGPNGYRVYECGSYENLDWNGEKRNHTSDICRELTTLRTSLEKARDALRPFAAVANDRSLGLSKECFDRASSVLKELARQSKACA